MKLKAKHWVNYQGTWYKAGDVFKIFDGEAEEMKNFGEIIEEDEPKQAEDEPEPEEAGQEEPVRRGRKRKLEE